VEPRLDSHRDTPDTEELADAIHRHFAASSYDPILFLCRGRIVFVNQALVRLLNAPAPEELLGCNPLTFIHPEQHDIVRQRIATVIEQRESTPPAEQHWLTVDGKDIWVEVNATAFRFSGEAASLVVARDISARRRAHQELQVAHAESELLLATLSTILIGIDINDRITRWNLVAEQTFGVPASRAIGRTLEECQIRLDWAELFLAINRCFSHGGAVELIDLPYVRVDGRDGFLSLNISSSWASSGDGSENLGVVLVGTDTTERRVLDSQRQQGLKLEAIGQLAAGIAHEINTPVQFIGDNLRFLADSFADLGGVLASHTALLAACKAGNADARALALAEAAARKADLPYLDREIPKAIAQSLEGTERVAQIVRAMKEFSHPDEGEKKPIDLNRTLTTTLTVARNEYKYLADVVTDFAADLPAVPCNAGELNQVFLNLIVNAAHAIEDVEHGRGLGTITIRTRRDGMHAEVRISDTGTGIPEMIRGKIFDPFFTTKGVGKGTGQGLFLAHTIVTKKHGGTIGFETEMGKGTTFIIRLPGEDLTP
jgi:PAS domain S-box-containing protein